MVIKWILKCDRCGYEFDATQEEFVQSGSEDLCIECWEKEE